MIPWTALLSNALTLADAAARLWTGTREKKITADPSHGISVLEARLVTLETRASDLEKEAAAASEVIRSLAQQCLQSAQALDLLRRRTMWLTWTCAGLGAAVLATVAWVVAGRT
jgi:hypothetical protein